MIWLYSGTPGSGKSFHAARDIYYRLRKKRGFRYVIANFAISQDTRFFKFIDNFELTPRSLMNYARLYHQPGIESQTLVIVDEAQIIFNSRNWNSDGGLRMDWIKFFTQHRKLGFDFILIAQNDRMIDRQIRCLIEYEVSHMKIGNYFRFLPFTCFMAVQRWYGQKMKVAHEVIVYRQKIADMYDTYKMFSRNGLERYKCRKLAGWHRARARGTGSPARRLCRSA